MGWGITRGGEGREISNIQPIKKDIAAGGGGQVLWCSDYGRTKSESPSAVGRRRQRD